MVLLVTVIVVALVFAYINGFHDTANAIATVVATRQLSPRVALVLASSLNFAGALCGTAIALTVSRGLVDSEMIGEWGPHAMSKVLLGALASCILWNLFTWWRGMPSSTSHAIIGGLCGAAVFMTGSFSVIYWETASGEGHRFWEGGGLLWKVIVPMFASPFTGVVIAWVMLHVIHAVLRSWRPVTVNRTFGPLQVVSSGYMAFSHGLSDAPMAMGVMILALETATGDGLLSGLPGWLSFLRIDEQSGVPLWIKVLCGAVLAAGTAAGGWKIIKTMGHRLVRLRPVDGFVAEATAASVLLTTGLLGMPVSTTHVITSAIAGTGCAVRRRSLRGPLMKKILVCWGLTFPCTFLLGYGLVAFLESMRVFPG